MSHEPIIDRVSAYYSGKLAEHGPNARGVDWNSEESQVTRFQQLLAVCRGDSGYTILDYGCGYGALSGYLHEHEEDFRYQGFDVSESMVQCAVSLHPGCDRCTFESDREKLEVCDYAVASGVFNVKLETPENEWADYVAQSLGQLDRLSAKGFAFNMLTSYSDADRKRPDLYYGEPGHYFDYCVRRFSRWVAVYHDYGLYEFTVVVRKALDS